MYRAVAWRALARRRSPLTDEARSRRWPSAREFDVSDGRVRIDGHDVAQAIRTPEIDAAAAAVARQPRVRAVLVERQRALGARAAW